MVAKGGDAPALLQEIKAQRVTDPQELAEHVDQVLARYANRVQAYHEGKTGLAGFFVGQVLKRVRGKASPHQVKAAVEKALSES